jgi:Domain of unknown function (DUF4411)
VSPETVYSVDTSALIDGLERYYRPTSFPSLWEQIDNLIDRGRLLCSEEVLEEATLRDLPAKQWCLERQDRLIVATDALVGHAPRAEARDGRPSRKAANDAALRRIAWNRAVAARHGNAPLPLAAPSQLKSRVCLSAFG